MGSPKATRLLRSSRATLTDGLRSARVYARAAAALALTFFYGKWAVPAPRLVVCAAGRSGYHKSAGRWPPVRRTSGDVGLPCSPSLVRASGRCSVVGQSPGVVLRRGKEPSYVAQDLSAECTPRLVRFRNRAHVRSSTQRSRRVRFHRLLVETLEPRTLLANIHWITPAGGSHWEVASNWRDDQNVNRLPATADDVYINDGQLGSKESRSRTRAGLDTIHSLTSKESLAISGGSLALEAASEISAGFSLSGGGSLLGAGVLTVGPCTGRAARWAAAAAR